MTTAGSMSPATAIMASVIAFAPAHWANLFVAAAGAAAGLTGLVFVAVSINIRAILDKPGLPERALATVMVLLNVAVVSLILLAPGQASQTLGIEVLGENLALLVVLIALLRASLAARDPGEPAYLATYAFTTTPGVVPFVASGASLLAGGGGGLYWTFGGILGALVGGVISAWVFLVEILR